MRTKDNRYESINYKSVTRIPLATAHLIWGGGVAQLLERRTTDSMIRVRITPGAQGKLNDFFPSQRCADSLSVCPSPVCIRTHKNDHVRTLKKILSVVKGNVRVRWIMETLKDPACTCKDWVALLFRLL